MILNILGEKVGLGVYCSPKNDIIKYYPEIIDFNGINYKVGFIVKLKPDKIRLQKTNKDLWVIKGNNNEIRPYVLFKKIMIKIKYYC